MNQSNETNYRTQVRDNVLACFNHLNLICDSSGRAFARVPFDTHHETLPVESPAFRAWLQNRSVINSGSLAPKSEIEQAVLIAQARAHRSGHVVDIRCRVAGSDEVVVADLGDETYEAVEVSETQWKIIQQPPIDFIRPGGYRALPRPVADKNALRRFQQLFALDDNQFRLLITWLVNGFYPRGPYPILSISGEYCSHLGRTLRSFIDPSSMPIRGVPRDLRDFLIAISRSWVSVFDTATSAKWFDQGLSILFNGDGSGFRKLYADDDEVTFVVRRPIVLVGAVQTPIGRASDATLCMELVRPSPTERRFETEIETEVAEIRPALFAYLLDCLKLAIALRDYRPNVLPNLAEFAALGARLELGLGWPRGSFATAYATGRLADSPIARLVLRFGLARRQWRGSATELFSIVTGDATVPETTSGSWPADAAAFGKILRKKAGALLELGLRAEFERNSGDERKRIISLTAEDGTE